MDDSVNVLATWEELDLKRLCEKLTRALTFTEKEALLYKKLVERLLTPETVPSTFGPEQAAEAMGLVSAEELKDLKKVGHKLESTDMDPVYQNVKSLRKKIVSASTRFWPDLGLTIDNKNYALWANGMPPWLADGSAKRRSIGLLIAHASDWFAGSLMRGIIQVCNKVGFDLVTNVSDDTPVLEDKRFRRMVEKTEGILIVPVGDHGFRPDFHDLLKKKDCVLVDRYFNGTGDVPCVHHNDRSAGRRAGEYLKGEGCERVFVIHQRSRSQANNELTPLRDRETGCRLQIGNKIDVVRLDAQGVDEQGGFDALRQFEDDMRNLREMEGENDGNKLLGPGDGIFATTDKLALGCRHYLADRQGEPLNLPLIAAEGQAFGRFLDPPLVSIRLDVEELGRVAARVLFATMGVLRDFPPSDCRPHYLIKPKVLRPDGVRWDDFQYQVDVDYYAGLKKVGVQ